MIVIGISGSIASGKSTVASFFKELGAHVIDWDVIAREVQHPHMKAWEGIVEYFGKEILDADLTLNRPKLAEAVFNDKAKLNKLNQIVHPEIFKEDSRITKEIEKLEPNALVIKDIPLLLEFGDLNKIAEYYNIPDIHIRVDKIVVVYASEETQLKRLAEKGMSQEDARSRIKSQVPLSEKAKLADYVIHNDGTLDETKQQVAELYHSLTASEEVK